MIQRERAHFGLEANGGCDFQKIASGGTPPIRYPVQLAFV